MKLNICKQVKNKRVIDKTYEAKTYDIMFDMVVMLTNLFNSINPIKIRYEKSKDIFRLVKRTIIYNSYLIKKSNKETKMNKNVIYREEGDNWF